MLDCLILRYTIMHMTGIQFDNDQQGGYYAGQQSQQPAMTRWLLSKHIVSDERQAQYVLLGVTIGAFLLSLFFFTR